MAETQPEPENDGVAEFLDACRDGRVEVVQALLKDDVVDLDARDQEGKTPLTVAAAYGQTGIVHVLLKSGAPVDVLHAGLSPLAYAAANGHVAVARLLLQAEANVDEQLIGGETALAIACQGGYLEVARELIQFGAAIGLASDDGCTPLMFAAIAGYTAVVGLILEKEASSINTTDNVGATALAYASVNDH